MKRYLLILFLSIFLSGFFVKAKAQCPTTIICDPQGPVICSDTAAFLSIVSPTDAPFQWYKNDVLITDSTRPILRVRDAGAYKAKVSGCGSFSNVITIIVNQSPTGNITVSELTPVCSGTLLTLTVNSSYFFSWLGPIPPGTAANPWTGIVTSSFVAGAVLYNASSGCTDVILLPVPVHPTINPGTISADQVICSGTAPALLTGTMPSGGSGTYIFQWQSSIFPERLDKTIYLEF
jgi:hypothetical protein